MPRAEPSLQNRMGVVKSSRGVRPTVQESGDSVGQTFHKCVLAGDDGCVILFTTLQGRWV